MKATQVLIKKECRELHGQEDALLKALEFVTEKYNFLLSADYNRDKTIRIEIHID